MVIESGKAVTSGEGFNNWRGCGGVFEGAHNVRPLAVALKWMCSHWEKWAAHLSFFTFLPECYT